MLNMIPFAGENKEVVTCDSSSINVMMMMTSACAAAAVACLLPDCDECMIKKLVM